MAQHMDIQEALDYCLANPDNLDSETLLARFPEYRADIESLVALGAGLREAVAEIPVPVVARLAIKERLVAAAAMQAARPAVLVPVEPSPARATGAVQRTGWWGHPALSYAAAAAILLFVVGLVASRGSLPRVAGELSVPRVSPGLTTPSTPTPLPGLVPPVPHVVAAPTPAGPPASPAIISSEPSEGYGAVPAETPERLGAGEADNTGASGTPVTASPGEARGATPGIASPEKPRAVTPRPTRPVAKSTPRPAPPATVCDLSIGSSDISCGTGNCLTWSASVRNGATSPLALTWTAQLQISERGGGFHTVEVTQGASNFAAGDNSVQGSFCYTFPADTNNARVVLSLNDGISSCGPPDRIIEAQPCVAQPPGLDKATKEPHAGATPEARPTKEPKTGDNGDGGN